MHQGLVQHFIESDRIDEKTSVDSVNQPHIHVKTVEVQPVDAISRHRLFLTGLQNDSWNVKMLSIGEGLVDPRLDDSSIKHVSSTAHPHNLLDSVLELGSISNVRFSETLLAVMK